MALQLVTGDAPAYWASALINGDWSGLDEAEKGQAIAFVTWLGAWPVSCDPAGFKRVHDATQFGALAADCETYSALVEGESGHAS